MKTLTLLVGPPGSGKSTLAQTYVEKGFVRINQDEQCRQGHWELFNKTITLGLDIIIDRMNFNKQQRNKYISFAKEVGYYIEIIVLHENYSTCLDRCLKRENHPTVKTEQDARSALATFFGKYEKPTADEADVITNLGWKQEAVCSIVVCDLDGSLCNIDQRLHFVKNGNRDWKNFFYNIPSDIINEGCHSIIRSMFQQGYKIYLASGRPDDYQKITKDWLVDNQVEYHHLFMRKRGDYRRDNIVKEIILDFEILTRGKPILFIDDRQQVVDKWRSRGFVCFQCDVGNF